MLELELTDMTVENGGWVVSGVLTVIATLASVVALLFKLNESKNTIAISELNKRLDKETAALQVEVKKANDRALESDKKHEECQRDREELRVKIAGIEGQVKVLNENGNSQSKPTDGR